MHAPVWRADLLLLLTALIWGSGFVAQRVGMESMGPMLYNALRFALGALVIVPLALRPRRVHGGRPLGPGQTLALGIGAGTILFLGASFQQVGLVYTTAGKAGFITGLYVVMVPVFALLIRQRSGAGTWAGAALAAAGMYFLSVTEAFTVNPGDLLNLAGAVFWAFHVLLLGTVASRAHSVRLALVQFLVCAALSLAVAVAAEPLSLAAVRAGIVPVLYGGVLSVGVGYTLQVVAQRDAVAAHAAIILSLEAVFAALTGWLVLDETLGSRGLLGCALMLAGMLVAQITPLWMRRRAPHARPDRALPR